MKVTIEIENTDIERARKRLNKLADSPHFMGLLQSIADAVEPKPKAKKPAPKTRQRRKPRRR